MLRAHRVAHRRIWLALGPLLTLGVLIGLVHRPQPLIQPPPPLTEIPAPMGYSSGVGDGP
jgi:hypothetical protein